MKDHEQVDALEYSVDEQNEEYKEWLTFAKMDFESAKYLNGAAAFRQSIF